MADVKFSQFVPGGALQSGDKIVGLRGGLNTEFDATSNTDDLPQGTDNWYATEDGGDTDNLATLPTIVNIDDEISSIQSDISGLSAHGIAVYVDAVNGINAVGRGSEGAPYLTIGYAISQITDASFTKQYQIESFGDVAETNFGFPPNISYDFHNGSFTVTNQTFPDSSWDGTQGVVVMKNLKRANFQGGIYFDFSFPGAEPLAAYLDFENCEFDCNQLFYFQGHTNNPCILRIDGMYAVNNTPSLQIKDFAYKLTDVACNNFFHQHVNNNSANLAYLSGLKAAGSFESQNFAASGIALTMLGCSVNTPIFNGQGVGTLLVRSFGNYFNGNVTFQVASGHPEYINFIGDILQNSPVLLGGATYTPVSIADSIKANLTPDAYTPTDISVKGNLSGINTALKHTYQWVQLLTGDVTLSQGMVGYCVMSDDVAQHTITLQLNSTISADAELQIIARGNYGVAISIPFGMVVNNQGGGTITIPAAGAYQATVAMLRRLATNTYALQIAPVSPADFYQLSNSFSEVSTYPDLNRSNLGLPSNILTLDQNQDDVVTNPCPQIIYVNKTVADFNIDLPAFNTIDSPLTGGLLGGNPITIAASTQCASQFVRDSLGQNILQINAGDTWILTPVGYTLSELTGWAARKVGGSGAGQDMQETYNQGSTIAMNEGQPIVITAGEVTPGQGINFVQQYSPASFPPYPYSTIVGMSFTMNKDGVISALGYADTMFSSGTREVGLWEYTTSSTGTLLATANVAKSDPLDTTTGKFRMHAITPVAVSNGARYVLAELNPITDNYLGYSTFNPSFCVADGRSQVGYPSATLVYPPIMDFPFDNAAQYGNATLEFQPTTGYTSTEETNTLTDSIYFKKITTSAQVTQPFGIGTTAQRDAISTTNLEDGAMWNNTTTHTIDRWNDTTNIWENGGGTWTPTLTSVSGISGSVTLNAARYVKNGKNITCVIDVSFTASATANVFGVSCPITPAFSNTSQASLMGGVLTTAAPAVTDGNIVNAASDNTNQRVNVTTNSTVGSGTKIVRCSFMYEVQ